VVEFVCPEHGNLENPCDRKLREDCLVAEGTCLAKGQYQWEEEDL